MPMWFSHYLTPTPKRVSGRKQSRWSKSHPRESIAKLQEWPDNQGRHRAGEFADAKALSGAHASEVKPKAFRGHSPRGLDALSLFVRREEGIVRHPDAGLVARSHPPPIPKRNRK